MVLFVVGCFFFSGRRRHTRYWRDWSSDVCSSDLDGAAGNDQAYGIYLNGVSSSVSGSTAHDSSQYGIAAWGDGSSVAGSTAYNDGTGIYARGTGDRKSVV